jgi:arsenate reductase (thioredoxin)
MNPAKPIVLILCTGNSCRSQMAEGLLRKHQGGSYDVRSAGTEPRDRVHPLAVQVMAEIGIDISAQCPKGIDEFLGTLPVKHLIIVCNNANQTCPRIWPGTYTRAYLPFDDPAEASGTESEKLEVFRRVRDEIDAAMRTWRPERTQ